MNQIFTPAKEKAFPSALKLKKEVKRSLRTADKEKCATHHAQRRRLASLKSPTTSMGFPNPQFSMLELPHPFEKKPEFEQSLSFRPDAGTRVD
jgi:hypothetical protein